MPRRPRPTALPSLAVVVPSAAPVARAAVALALLAAASLASAGEYETFYGNRLKIDSGHSLVGFAVSFTGLGGVEGRFTEYAGTLVFDPDEPGRSSITVIIDAKSLDTANGMRDEDLRGANFFDVEKHPQIRFRSTAVLRRGAGYLLRGPLTLHSVTREVEIPFTRLGEGLYDQWGNKRVAFEGSVTLDRADYGIGGQGRFDFAERLVIGLEVEIRLRIQAVQWNVEKWNLPENSIAKVLAPLLDEQGVAAAVARYRELRAGAPEAHNFEEGNLNILGHRLLQARRVEPALEIFRLNAEVYPESTNAHDDLATAQAVLGQREAAVGSARRALELDPDNTDALELLRRLEEPAPG